MTEPMGSTCLSKTTDHSTRVTSVRSVQACPPPVARHRRGCTHEMEIHGVLWLWLQQSTLHDTQLRSHPDRSPGACIETIRKSTDHAYASSCPSAHMWMSESVVRVCERSCVLRWNQRDETHVRPDTAACSTHLHCDRHLSTCPAMVVRPSRAFRIDASAHSS